jgi:hypothetical protein
LSPNVILRIVQCPLELLDDLLTAALAERAGRLAPNEIMLVSKSFDEGRYRRASPLSAKRFRRRHSAPDVASAKHFEQSIDLVLHVDTSMASQGLDCRTE